MIPSILGLTFNDLTSLYRTKPEINTSKSETDPIPLQLRLFSRRMVLDCSVFLVCVY